MKVLESWCQLLLVRHFPRNGIDPSLQWVNLESFWLSFLLLHILCSNQGPLVPSQGLWTWFWKDIQQFLPYFPFSAIHMTHSQTIFWVAYVLLSIFKLSPKGPASWGWMTHSWPKFRFSSFCLFFHLSLTSFTCWAFMALLNFTN